MGCPDCVPPIPPCPAAFWDGGWWPSVAVDARGGVRVAYEVQLDVGGGACTAGVMGRISRLATIR